MYRFAPRGTTRLLPALVMAGIALAACSSSPGPAHSSGTTTTTAGAATTTSTAAVPTSTTTTLPTSGPLQAGSPIAVPLAASQVLATEGPDGAVFVAAQAPDSPTPSVVYVIDGNGPASVAEHISSGIAALSADASNLYVATYHSVTAYSRTSGNQSGQWTLPAIRTANSSDADLVAMTVGGGAVYVSVAQGNGVEVLKINPSATAAPVMVAQSIGGVAVGSDGTVYYENASKAFVALHPSGSTTTGPDALADSPNGEGGGVQNIVTVAGGEVWVNEPAGQGLDAGWATYDASTLAPVGTFGGNVGETFVNTSAGVFVLTSPDAASSCPSSANTSAFCVARVTPAGVMSDPLPFTQALTLIGPDPVVIEANASFTALELVRLS